MTDEDPTTVDLSPSQPRDGYVAIGEVAGWCGHVHRRLATAAECIEDDRPKTDRSVYRLADGEVTDHVPYRRDPHTGKWIRVPEPSEPDDPPVLDADAARETFAAWGGPGLDPSTRPKRYGEAVAAAVTAAMPRQQTSVAERIDATALRRLAFEASIPMPQLGHVGDDPNEPLSFRPAPGVTIWLVWEAKTAKWTSGGARAGVGESDDDPQVSDDLEALRADIPDVWTFVSAAEAKGYQLADGPDGLAVLLDGDGETVWRERDALEALAVDCAREILPDLGDQPIHPIPSEAQWERLRELLGAPATERVRRVFADAYGRALTSPHWRLESPRGWFGYLPPTEVARALTKAEGAGWPDPTLAFEPDADPPAADTAGSLWIVKGTSWTRNWNRRDSESVFGVHGIDADEARRKGIPELCLRSRPPEASSRYIYRAVFVPEPLDVQPDGRVAKYVFGEVNTDLRDG